MLGLLIILKNNGGDDWNDKPYQDNAEEPYDTWSELVEDNKDMLKRKWKHHPIKLVKIYFELEDNYMYNVLPCDRGNFSVEEINKGITPWIWTDEFKIDAGTTLKEFFSIIKRHDGKIYTSWENLYMNDEA